MLAVRPGCSGHRHVAMLLGLLFGCKGGKSLRWIRHRFDYVADENSYFTVICTGAEGAVYGFNRGPIDSHFVER